MNETKTTSVLAMDVPGRRTTAWWDYVENVAGSETLAEIVKRTGISMTTVPRWRRSTRRVDAGDAIAFARAYGRPPLEALVVAGYLTEAEAHAWGTG